MEQQNITRLLHITALALLFGCATLSVLTPSLSAQNWNDPNADLEERFRFTWDSVELSTKIENPGTSEDAKAMVPTRTFDIPVTLDILDANDLIAMYVDEPQILYVADGTGAPVKWTAQQTQSARAYQRVKWGYVWEATRPVKKLQPSALNVHVELASNQPVPSSLSTIHGYVYAIYADEVIEVDVPFAQTVFTYTGRPPTPDPNEGWIDVAHDLMIRVLTVATMGTCVWYETEVKATSGTVRGLTVAPLYGIGDFAVIGMQLLDSDREHCMSHFLSQEILGPTTETAACSGETDFPEPGIIRHVIAVSPVEVKIPFELRNIPVPSLDPVDE